jgi:transglutaminase-like putative cysteine protease
MKLQIEHHTVYRYTQPLSYAIQTLCLTPQSGPTQRVHDWQIIAPGQLKPMHDAYGNQAHTLTYDQKPIMYKTLSAKGMVETLNVAEFHETAATSPFVYLRETTLSRSHSRLTDFAQAILKDGVNKEAVLALASAVSARVHYKQGTTEVNTTAEEAFDLSSGVCQDQAHVLIAACRSQGIPARYVSGYFYAPYAPELASHAWADVCLDVDTQQWISVDITHACLTDERHIRLAVGADYAACSPVRGVRHGGGDEIMTVEVSIRPV